VSTSPPSTSSKTPPIERTSRPGGDMGPVWAVAGGARGGVRGRRLRREGFSLFFLREVTRPWLRAERSSSQEAQNEGVWCVAR
jgi:hypothetical protein